MPVESDADLRTWLHWHITLTNLQKQLGWNLSFRDRTNEEINSRQDTKNEKSPLLVCDRLYKYETENTSTEN